MNPLRINRMKWSELVWSVLAEAGKTPTKVLETAESADWLRAGADYDTGSLALRDVERVYSIARYFQPRVVAEVGTFIGRSTAALAYGMREGVIHTCDGSNDIELPPFNHKVEVIQYAKTLSTDMFKKLSNESATVDLFYIDGRLQPEDVTYMAGLSHSGTLFVLDDFEGLEKGVSNASLLTAQWPNHFLVYPAHGDKTAILIPATTIQFVRQ